MASATDTMDRFIAVAMGTTTKGNLKGNNVLAEGDIIYSYGTHFEMARLMRDKKGAPSHWLINGERYSVTTSQHQSHMRYRIADTKLPSVTIPHGALRAAGITDFASITILDDQPETNVVTEHDVTVMPAGARWGERIDQVSRDKTDTELDADVAALNARWQADYESRVESAAKYEWATAPDSPPRLATRDDIDQWNRRTADAVPTRVLWANGRKARTIDVVEVDGVTHYRWKTFRHWLGESLISATVAWTTVEYDGTRYNYVNHTRRAKFLSGFDHQERRMSYFFCELPRTSAATVAQAYEALKPQAVLVAEQVERPVFRQGDIFAVQMDLTTRNLRAAGATFTKRGTLLGTNHEATETAVLPSGATLARGSLYHVPAGRDPDHARITLAKGAWCIVVKNRVPLGRKPKTPRRQAQAA